METPVVQVRGLNKSFGGVVVANEINIELSRGTVVGLIGPNGAGKTSLFNLICGLVSPDSGTVLVHGQDVTRMPMYRRARRGVSRTWQDVKLFESLSILDNLLVSAHDYPGESLFSVYFRHRRVSSADKAARSRAADLLELVGLQNERNALAVELPYGQRKLVAIARALMTSSDCLLLDEPMSGVEGNAYEGIREVIRRVADQGAAVCVVEHNVSFVADLCQRAYFMNFGKVIGNGTVKELVERSDLSDLYFGSDDV